MKLLFNFWKQLFFTKLCIVDDDAVGEEDQEVVEEQEDRTVESLADEIFRDDDSEDSDESPEEAEKEEEVVEPVDEAPEEVIEEDPYKEPEGLTEKASDRFKSLVESNKEKDTQLEEARQYADSVRELFEYSKANDQELQELFDYSAMIKSGDRSKQLQALETLTKKQRELADYLGVAANGFDPISKHPDLAGRVNQGEIDRDSALQIAEARQLQINQQAEAQRMQEMYQRQQQQSVSEQQAVSQIRDLESQWRSSDVDFGSKIKYLEGKAQDIMRDFQPQQWPAALKMAYDAITSTAKPASVARTPSPARPNTATSGVKQAETIEELASQIFT